jgi:hypothetical protein
VGPQVRWAQYALRMPIMRRAQGKIRWNEARGLRYPGPRREGEAAGSDDNERALSAHAELGYGALSQHLGLDPDQRG